MKRILPFGIAAAITLPLLAATLPFVESFNSGMGEFVIIDGNEDGNTIKTTSYYGYSWSQGLYYEGNSDAADEWLITPSFSLQAGYIYELTFYQKVSSSGTVNRVEWKAGKSASVADMTVDIAPAAEYSYDYGSWIKETVKVSVPEDGDYYLGMHIISDASQGAFYFDQIEISEGVAAGAPLAPEVASPVFSVVDDAIQASFDVTFPTLNAAGETLAEDSQLEVRVSRSDSDKLETISGTPGAVVTYTDTEATAQSVTYSFVCAAGDLLSPATDVASSPRFGTPMAVANFNVSQTDNQFQLSWDPVTEATSSSDLFIPSSVTYLVKCNGEIVADNTTELSAEYTVPMPDEGQDQVSFTIVAISNSKTSAVTASPGFLVGNPYVGEFVESFADMAYSNNTWVVENNETSRWRPSIGSSYPVTINPQDNDGGCLEFGCAASEQRTIWSPILSLSGLQNAKLKFWVFLNPSASYETKVQPGFLVDGVTYMLGDEAISMKSGDTQGWTEFTFDLPAEAVAAEMTQLLFVGYGSGNYNTLYLDNISIRSYLDHNLAVSLVAPAKSLELGQEVVFPVSVKNKGVNDEADYTLRLFANEEEVAAVAGDPVSAISEISVDLPFTVLPKYAGSDVVFKVVADMESDLDLADNEAEVSIPVNENELTCPGYLSASVNKEECSATLSWEAPIVSTDPVYSLTTESFEEWETGSMEPMGDWIFIDKDGVNENGINNVNKGVPMAAMITENYTPSYDAVLTCPDGVKCLAISVSSSYGGSIDNWVISPIVKGGTDVTFKAQNLSSYGSGESFDILYSEGGTETEDFTLLETLTAPRNGWTDFSVTLPENAKRFAINVHGSHYDPIVFDLFSFTAMSEPALLTGYNLYRNDLLIVSLPLETLSYTDENLEKNVEYLYAVTALYDKGESLYSNKETVLIELEDGVTEIRLDDADVELFDLQGIRIARPVKGQVVIVRQNGKSFKALIK
ncbi:MAG: choice-of-anchor J domain-containing protein [Lepagella sp.]